jgi:hypothetical protein
MDPPVDVAIQTHVTQFGPSFCLLRCMGVDQGFSAMTLKVDVQTTVGRRVRAASLMTSLMMSASAGD